MSLLEDLFQYDDQDHGDRDGEGGYGHRPSDMDTDHEGDGHRGDDPDQDSDNQHSQAEEDKPKKVDPTKEKKVKIVKNPRAVLNPKRLTGPRGIQTIEEFFKDFQFQGKGHEVEDLNLLMKKLEHWAHRLYPKFQFDDCLEKIANLGSKKEVITHVKRIRMNMIQEDVPIRNQSDSEDEENRGPVLDEFDLLLDQQIALARSTPATNMKTVVQYDDSTISESPRIQLDNSSIVNSTPIQPNNGLTEEQVARMMRNRVLAEERRLARLKMTQEKENKENIESSPMNTEEISESLENTENIM